MHYHEKNKFKQQLEILKNHNYTCKLIEIKYIHLFRFKIELTIINKQQLNEVVKVRERYGL